MAKLDLHCHSTASDGALPPAELVARAAARGSRMLALTDHDCTAGLAEAGEAAREHGLDLIRGVEISVSWRTRTIHIVGLDIDPDCPALAAGLRAVREGRVERAQRMEAALAKIGIHGAFDGAMALCGNPEMIGRTHFARFLVESGEVKNVATVFRKYLVKGKPGYVPHQWAELADAVGWIRAAGGVAVIAHPGRYEIGRQLQGIQTLGIFTQQVNLCLQRAERLTLLPQELLGLLHGGQFGLCRGQQLVGRLA